jgi:hypothetical protein
MSLDSLTVYKSKYPKCRVGSIQDGGYVIADGLEYDLLLSCGIGNDISFEKEFLKKYPTIKCYAFDGTINMLPDYIERLEFINKNIGPLETQTTTNLHEIINRYNNIFLKIDIESYEFRWIQTLSREQLQKFKQIVIEYHFPFTPASFSHFDIPLPVSEKMDVINKVATTHSIIHLHGNNCCGTTIYNDITVPNIFECTYLRNDTQEFIELNDEPIPSILDKPNVGGNDICLKGYPFTRNPEVVHTYLQKTTVNSNIGGQPPGFADYLRGTIALYQHSKKYNYTLRFDINSHPLFKYLNIPKPLISTMKYSSTFELLPPYGYHEMPCIIDTMLLSGTDISILTNCFYEETPNMDNSYNFIKSILNPSDNVLYSLNKLRADIGIDSQTPFSIIHIRLGDKYLVNKDTIDDTLVIKIREYIYSIKINTNVPLIVIADSKEIKDKINDLCYTTTCEPIHTGSLDVSDIDQKLIMVLTEFFLMSMAKEIYCINFHDGSGFSKICSKIYSIPYHTIQL